MTDKIAKTQLPFFVLRYSYKNTDEVVALKITREMSKGAYEIAKKVYSGQITRTEGKIEINRVTGMNEGSAQAFITIFLAMMNGEEYKRALTMIQINSCLKVLGKILVRILIKTL